MLTNCGANGSESFRSSLDYTVDYRENIVYTKLPNGKDMKLRVRKEEADQVRKLEQMEDVHVFENPPEG